MGSSQPPTEPELVAAFRSAVRAKIARDLEAEHRLAEEIRARVLSAVATGLARARERGLCGVAWLFGSHAWGKPTERSDVDLMVESCRDPDLLASVVGQVTNTEVHVVRMEDAPASLRDRVLTEGRRL